MTTTHAPSRREFFRHAARTLVLGGLGALAAELGRRRLRVPAAQRCRNRGICRGCTRFERCRLPAAESARQGGMQPSARTERGEAHG